MVDTINSSEDNNSNFLKNQIIVIIFIVLAIFGSGLTIYLVYKTRKGSETVNDKIQYQRETKDLYQGVSLERDQRGLTRGRFIKLTKNTLFLEYYYGKVVKDASAPEAITLTDRVVFNCEERYFTASDGTRIDKLNAMTDTTNYNGVYVPGGLGIKWFKKNVQVGEAVEVRFLGDGASREPAQVLLYKDSCS